jgi:hypothetical protein
VEGVQDGVGVVGQFTADGVGIAAERVQRGVGDAVDELAGLGADPVGVDRSGAAEGDVEQAGVDAAVLVAGEVDDGGDGPVAVAS